jgi:hypothetical protein
MAKRNGVTKVREGSHYLSSAKGHFDFGKPIGELLFRGRPMGPGNTDTIYQRRGEVALRTLGQSATVPIEMTAVSLESIKPVKIDGVQYDVFIRLTPGTRSTGEMTIVQTSPDDGTSAPNGIYNTNVAIYFTAEFTPRGKKGKKFEKSADIFIQSTAPGRWTFNPDANFVTTTKGPRALRTSNFFLKGEIPMLDLASRAGGANSPAKL